MRRPWKLVLIGGSVAALCLASARDGAADAGGSEVVFELQVDPRKKGDVRCALYRDASTWLSASAFRVAVVAPSAPLIACRFEDVPEGTYAAAAFHDEDGDGKLGKNFLGIPREGYAASRNAHRGVLGPPSWRAAAFVHGKEPSVVRAEMKY